MAIAVDVRHVSKSYGRNAVLRDVCLHVPAGSALGLVGPNGAGKSTLLRILLGVARPSLGNVWYNDRPLWPHPEEHLANVGGFVDTPWFYPQLTAQENMWMLADLTQKSRRRADEVLAFVHLQAVKHERVSGFSHGMRQRLALAIALMKNPALIILDEPQDGLDPARLNEMRHLIERVRRESGATLIMASHVMPDIEQLCDFIAVFDEGRIRYFGAPSQLGRGIISDEVFWEVSPVDSAIGCLAELGITARVTGSSCIVAPWDDQFDLGDVNRMLIKKDIVVRTVARRRAGLDVRLLTYLEDSHVDARSVGISAANSPE